MKNKSCTCTGRWECSLLEHIPPPEDNTIKEKAKTFVKLYRTAKKLQIFTRCNYPPDKLDRLLR